MRLSDSATARQVHQEPVRAENLGSAGVAFGMQLRAGAIGRQSPRLPPVPQADIEELPELRFGVRGEYGVTTSTRFERLRNIQSAEPMRKSPSTGFSLPLAKWKTRECSRKRPMIERTRMFSVRPGRRDAGSRSRG